MCGIYFVLIIGCIVVIIFIRYYSILFYRKKKKFYVWGGLYLGWRLLSWDVVCVRFFLVLVFFGFVECVFIGGILER